MMIRNREENSESDLKSLFDSSRCLWGAGILQIMMIIVYAPFGFLVALARLFIALGLFMTLCFIPKNVFLRRILMRFGCGICGLIVRVERPPNVPMQCKVLVCNFVSPVDRLACDLVQPCAMANEWGYPPFLSWLLGLEEFSIQHSRDKFIETAQRFCEGSLVPLFTRPEGSATSGRTGLLRFSVWPFQVSRSIQPVVLRVTRPLPLATTTLTSTVLSDVFWLLFTPYTVFHIRFLSEIEQDAQESAEDLSKRTQRSMAESMGWTPSHYTHLDKHTLCLRISDAGSPRVSEVHNDSTRPSQQDRKRVIYLPPELEQIVHNVKAVLPQVPLDVITREVCRTRDLDMTLSNLLEGNIEYTPESSELPKNTARSPSAMSPTTANTTSSSSQKQAIARHMSLADRKAAMIAQARERYMQKLMNKKTV